MSLKLAKLTVTIAAGASTGTGTFSPCPTGYLEELYLDYGQTSAATNVTITELGRSTPVLTVSNNQTDGYYYPRAIACGVAGGSFGSEGAVPIALAAPLYVSVTGGNVAASALTVYAKVRSL
jgi:fructose-specific phosphotransferase system IIC component